VRSKSFCSLDKKDDGETALKVSRSSLNRPRPSRLLINLLDYTRRVKRRKILFFWVIIVRKLIFLIASLALLPLASCSEHLFDYEKSWNCNMVGSTRKDVEAARLGEISHPSQLDRAATRRADACS
jgi:hypothetical protein